MSDSRRDTQQTGETEATVVDATVKMAPPPATTAQRVRKPPTIKVPTNLSVGDTTTKMVPPPPTKPRSRASRAASEPGVSAGVRGVKIPLVGRGVELGTMQEVVRQAIEFRAPQVITLVGNQGTGKSRLIEEFLLKLDPSVRVYQGFAGQPATRYGALAQLLRHRFGIWDGMSEPEIVNQVAAEVTRVFRDTRVSEVMFFIGRFLDVRLEDSPFLRAIAENPVQADEIARTILKRFIEVDAEQGPVVLLFDDMQWADDATLAVLREFAATLGGTALVLVMCGRPELTARISSWNVDEADCVRIDLRNLDEEEAEVMFRSLLSKCESLPEDLVLDACEMTGGNPAFLEQLVRLFLVNGTINVVGEIGSPNERWQLDLEKAQATELPISVQEAIEARVAALGTAERDFLEKGAVFGNVFWLGALVALTRLDEPELPANDDFLPWNDGSEPIRRALTQMADSLVERDYLLRLEPEDSTIPGDTELVYKHNLERELIAKSTEAKRLEKYHQSAAQWLETKLTSRSEEQLEFLAQLYERGNAQAQAARCYIAGAEKARARFANEAAISMYRKSLSLLTESESAVVLEVHHNLGSVLDLVGETAAARTEFSKMLSLSWRFDHKNKGGAAHARLARLCRAEGKYEQAMEHLRAAHELFLAVDDKRGVAAALDDIGRVHWLRGAYGQALEYHRQALAIRRAMDERRSIALSLANIGRVHNDSGAFKAATRQFREALDLRRDIGDQVGIVQSLCDLAAVQCADESYAAALELLNSALEIAQTVGDKLSTCDVLSRMGECKTQLGELMSAQEDLLSALATSKELGYRAVIAETERRVAEWHVVRGEKDQALISGSNALALSEGLEMRAQTGMAERVLACAWALEHTEKAQSHSEDHFRRALDIFAGMRNELELARTFRYFSTFCKAGHRDDESQKYAKRADEIYARLRAAVAGE